jgi:aspartate-semialdehyde dehydrogenase
MNKIGIIGVNGLVGKAILESINILNLQNNDYRFFSSNEGEIIFNSNSYKVEQFNLNVLKELEYAILAVDNKLAKLIYEYIFNENLNIRVIDNSSEFRLYNNVPLCIPEINKSKIKDSKFISNPNCVTTLMCIVLSPLMEIANINRIVCSTYQAASGAGYKGLEELELQTKQISSNENLTIDFWKKQYVYNVFSHNTKITSTGFNEEEMKLINETKKILNINPRITSTCIRVPTLRSHCISLNVEFDRDIIIEDILSKLNNFNGIKVYDDINLNKFPEPILTSGKTDVYVGRIRPDIDDLKCWNFFISGDQLLKGAGYNSVQILESIL